jgi:histidinol dehydrogenase
MLRRLDLRQRSSDSRPDVRSVLSRPRLDVEAAMPAGAAICDDVRARGRDAVSEASLKFDAAGFAGEPVAPSQLAAALEALAPPVRDGLAQLVERLRTTCLAESERQSVSYLDGGARVIQRKVPVGRAGIYVSSALASSVSGAALRIVPALVAGVPSIAVASPPLPGSGGAVHPMVLAACAFLGVEEVYAVGGAQAIGMLAHGAGDCAPVELIVAGGGSHTQAAKRHVSSTVSVSDDGGMAETVILADRWADPLYVAADVAAGAERDPDGVVLLVTPSEWFADDVEAELAQRGVPDPVRELLGSERCAIVLVDDMEHGVDVIDAYAPQCVEIHSAYAWSFATRIRNAGAVYVGPFSPVAIGDYGAGANVGLPTGGGPATRSALSVRTFVRTVELIDYTRDALELIADQAVSLATIDGLPAHAAAIDVRYEAARTILAQRAETQEVA